MIYGNIANAALLEKLDLEAARAVIVTMDEPVLVSHTIRRIRAAHPDLPIMRQSSTAPERAMLSPKHSKAHFSFPKPCSSTWASTWAR